MLEQSVDYTVGYNELTGVLLLTPLSTLWEQNAVYRITLDNTLIADRVGNFLRPNQDDGTTQFTIIMPDVELDYGDAPASYQTVLIDDGPRHSITDEATPRLGRHVDGEEDALVIDQDDFAVVAVEGNVGEPGDGPFLLSSPQDPQVTVELTAFPNVGDTLSVTTEGVNLIFELIPAGGKVSGFNRVPVVYDTTLDPLDPASLVAVMEDLANAMSSEFSTERFQAEVELTVGQAELTIEALDDEDGVEAIQVPDGPVGEQVIRDVGRALR